MNYNYNSLEGIRDSLRSLKDFEDLVVERHNAGYNRHESLDNFLVKGLWNLDSCGNCMRIMECPEDLKKHEVLLLKQFYALFPNESIGSTVGGNSSHLVPHDHICDVCGKGWTIENHADAEMSSHDSKNLVTKHFIGKPLKDIKEHYGKIKDTQYLFWGSYLKRDGKWLEEKDIPKDTLLLEGDEISVYTRNYRHRLCVKAKAYQNCFNNITADGLGYHLPNLAGRHECDEYIKAELAIANIPIIGELPEHSEVPYTFAGKIHNFHFWRAWTYWVVHGLMPLELANELYADPEGKKFVRVDGDCGCLEPKECTDTIDGKEYVTSYHIDTLAGLKLFATAAWLVKTPAPLEE